MNNLTISDLTFPVWGFHTNKLWNIQELFSSDLGSASGKYCYLTEIIFHEWSLQPFCQKLKKWSKKNQQHINIGALLVVVWLFKITTQWLLTVDVSLKRFLWCNSTGVLLSMITLFLASYPQHKEKYLMTTNSNNKMHMVMQSSGKTASEDTRVNMTRLKPSIWLVPFGECVSFLASVF